MLRRPVKRAVEWSWCAVLLVLTATAPAAQSAPPRETGRVDAARLMRDRRIHRLVAVDETGRPIGVLSASDFVELYADG